MKTPEHHRNKIKKIETKIHNNMKPKIHEHSINKRNS